MKLGLTWPDAFMWVGVAFAIAWALRSFFRGINGDKA